MARKNGNLIYKKGILVLSCRLRASGKILKQSRLRFAASAPTLNLNLNRNLLESSERSGETIFLGRFWTAGKP